MQQSLEHDKRTRKRHRYTVLKAYGTSFAFLIISLIVEISGVDPKFGFGSTWELQIVLFCINSLGFFIIWDIERARSETENFVAEATDMSRELHENLAEGYVTFHGQQYRLLSWRQERGEMYFGDATQPWDPNDRNVLFNVETIKALLQEAKLFKPSSRSGRGPVEKALRRVGRSAGTRFGKRFRDVAARVNYSLDSWLDEWRRYDTKAGLGMVSVRDVHWPKGRFTVEVQHSFLVTGDVLEDADSLNEYFAGYLEGLLTEWPSELFEGKNLDQSKLTVKHDYETDCWLSHNSPQRGCSFHVEIPVVGT